MPAMLLLIVIIAVVLLLAKAFYDGQRAQKGDAGTGGPARMPKAPRPRKPVVKIDEEKLAEHVAKLRKAVAAELVTTEEAVASIVRQAEGTLSEEAAQQLLNARDAA